MRRAFSLPILFALALLIALPPAPARAASLEPQEYRQAFAALDAGHADLAYSLTARGHDPVLNKVLRSYYMAAPGNDISFAESAAFIADNPGWPGLKDIIAATEQKISGDAAPAAVVNWFTAHPPVSLPGFYRYIDALNAVGRSQDALHFVRQRWVGGDFSEEELNAFYARFGQFLARDDHWARLDRLLWNNDSVGARRMYSFADTDMKTVAEARLALAGQRAEAENWWSNVSGQWREDPGLIYERLRWLRRGNRDDDAIQILDNPPPILDKADAWNEERQILARRAMEKQDYAVAYRLVAGAPQIDDRSSGKTFIQGEFLAGWLALRFLNRPDDARVYFQTIIDRATTPISKARGYYWLGRTLEVLGNKVEAEQAYESAAALNITYYGQLATVRLYSDPVIAVRPEPAIPEAVRNQFYARDMVRAVERLRDIGELDRAHTFFKAATDTATERVEFVLLTELAYKIRRADYAIEAAKAANQKNMLVAAGGFPVLSAHVPRPPDPAFTHALIRQESMFNPEAESPAGAVGLMQMMPRTAKAVAQKSGFRFKESRLTETDYNLRLGTAFVQQQLDSFNGSYVLALAAYNAGPGRVRQWLNEIGDPRSPNVDPIDWVELISVPETRNYVQRILENIQIYRARLNGGEAPLLIMQDLKR